MNKAGLIYSATASFNSGAFAIRYPTITSETKGMTNTSDNNIFLTFN